MPICMTSRRHLFLFPADTSRGWRVIRKVSRADAAQHAADGWKPVHDEISGELIGYQLPRPEEARGDRDLQSFRTMASISEREMQLNVERSRTAGLTEEQRLTRVAQHRMPEDAIERTQRKVLVWPHVGAAKGDILRVWPQRA